MSIDFFGPTRPQPNMSLKATANRTGVPQEAFEKFGELVSQAKSRLENPLRQAEFVSNDNDSSEIGFGSGFQSNLGGTDDPFSGVDSMNTRVFASIRDTISQKLAALKTGKSGLNVNGTEGISPSAILELSQMGTKIAELYSASDSLSYKKTAEKTIAKIASKLNSAWVSGDQSALSGLQSIQSNLPEESRPRFLLDLLLEDLQSDRG